MNSDDDVRQKTGSTHGMVNVIWALHDSADDLMDADVCLEEGEAERIMAELPTGFDSEVEA